jgi:hypothetical protein
MNWPDKRELMRRLTIRTLSLVAVSLVSALAGLASAQDSVTVGLPMVLGQANLMAVDGKTQVAVTAKGFGPHTAHGVMV